MIRMGGNKAGAVGFALGIGFYLQSARWPFYTERVPYRLILATLGYAAGVNIGSRLYGNK